MADDPFEFQRFVTAQAPVYDRVLGELRAGRKTSHWIWFILPQLAELGRSATAKRYGISGADEALAYLAHPVLGPHLTECTKAMLAIDGKSLSEIMPYPDDLKFVSSMTLFARVASDPVMFVAALGKFAAGQRDAATLDLLAK